MKLQIPSTTTVTNFSFQNWFIKSTEKSIELVEKFNKLNDKDHTNHSYSENASYLNQVLIALNEAIGSLRYNLEQTNQKYTDNDIAGKFAEISSKVIPMLKSVNLEETQLKELNDSYVSGRDTALDLYQLYGLYVVQYIVDIPSSNLASLDYKLLVVQHNNDNIKDGYHFDYLGVIVSDQYYILNVGLNADLLIKYPVNLIVDDFRDEVANNGINDPIGSANDVGETTKNTLVNAVNDDKNYIEQQQNQNSGGSISSEPTTADNHSSQLSGVHSDAFHGANL